VTRRRLERLLWVLALVAAGIAWARWRQVLPEPETSGPAAAAVPRPAYAADGAALASATAKVTAGNPFRLDRAPAPIGYSPDPPPGFGSHEFRPPAPPRPPLEVTGIVGPPWEALLTGVPGREGAVIVKPGDVLGDLRVRSVTRENVVVQAPDTTWRLSVKRTW
jgi:hypothetical protein